MISVVITIYNKAHTVLKTLDSVLNQVFQNYEVIIVNDGSTDNFWEIINQKINDKKIKIINQENKGVSNARNRGIIESKFEYVALLDGDDEWREDYLLKVVEMISLYPHAGLYLSGGIVSGNNGDFSFRLAKKYINKIGTIDLFENPEVFSHTSATVISKKAYFETKGYIDGMCKYEDYLLSQSIAMNHQVVYCGLPLSKYNGGIEGQLTQINRNINFEKAADSLVLYYNYIYENHKNSFIDNKTFYIYIKYSIRHLIKIYLKSNKFGDIRFIREKIGSEIWGLFLKKELDMYDKNYLFLSLIFINFTKILWRLNGFPIVGEKVNIKRLPKKYLTW